MCRPRLLPGGYRRITAGATSSIQPWLIFVRPGRYRQIFNLEKTAAVVVSRVFQTAFDAALKQALATSQ